MNSIKELSNMSYTNKDFNSIYVELLEYAKKLSYRWDPTASDESDPGVVLLKLAAIIGDKDNYNIDKNVLELMPVSVTQKAAARQLFDQCGYSMHHYVAARGYVNVKLTKDISPSLKELSSEEIATYTYDIPMFTMFTDVDQSVVYTTTAPLKTLNVNIPQPVEVIEGTIAHYSVNNDTTITLNNLDNRNRIYLTDYNVAENGIFIKNIGTENYEQWLKVDNLETQPIRTPCYKFGLLNDQSVCYIEFPDDAEFLFDQGINISYIKTSGSVGTVGKGRLSRLFVDTIITEHAPLVDATDISIKTDSTGIYIHNDTNINNGKDPESIDEAYKSYKRVKDTFDTLVSLKDYSDYLVTSEGASNGYVCDRNTDIQHSYKLLESNTATNVLRTIIEDAYKEKTIYNANTKQEEKVTIVEPAMLPFDLCVYALQPAYNIKDWTAFNKSFELLSTADCKKIFSNESSAGYYIKSLQHNFLDFEPEKILMIRNKYILPCTVLPRHKLAPSERFSIQSNLEDALFTALNSKNMTFGQRIDPLEIKNTMLKADARIKDIENNFSMTTYETYAVYMNKEGKFCELRIDDNSPVPEQDLIPLWDNFRAEVFAKNVLAGVSSLYSPDTDFVYSVNQKDTQIYNNITHFTTNAIIPLNVKEVHNETSIYATRELADAESILLTSPSYIDDNNYSTYTKFIYSVSSDSDIEADSKYTLKNDDFIIFFWKSASTDVDYTYMKYSAATLANVIKPTFNLAKVAPWVENLDESGLNVISYFRGLKDGSGRTSSTITSDALGGKSQTIFVSELTSERNGEVLVGNNIITTLKKNIVHVNQPSDQGASNIYWILNETVKNSSGEDVYRLFDEAFTDEEQTYTLQSGEYFVYTNNIKGALYIQGEGTIIKRKGFTGPSSVWEVEPCEIEDIYSEGPAALIDKWYKISLDNVKKLEVQEMQRIVIGPGTQLIAEYNGDTDIEMIELSSEPTNLKSYKLYYLDNFGVTQYIDNVSEGWSVSTLLNLSVNSTEPQNLIAGHSIIFSYVENDDEKQVEISVPIGAFEVTKCIFGNVSYTHVGGRNIPVTFSDESELDIMTYTALSSADPSIRYSNTEFTCEILPTKNNSSIILPEFRLLQGEYLINVSQPSEESVTLENIIIKNNIGHSISRFLNNSNIFLLTVKSDADLELQFNFNNVVSDDQVVTIRPIVRFSREKLNTISVGNPNKLFEDLLIEQFEKLDINRRCDYTSFEAEIDNPLNAASFLDSAHVYNPYTICQWTRTSKNGDIKVKLNVV